MDIEADAHAIIDANAYMTLGTADAGGLPWVTPVWFAPEGDRRFYWVSDRDGWWRTCTSNQPSAEPCPY